MLFSARVVSEVETDDSMNTFYVPLLDTQYIKSKTGQWTFYRFTGARWDERDNNSNNSQSYSFSRFWLYVNVYVGRWLWLGFFVKIRKGIARRRHLICKGRQGYTHTFVACRCKMRLFVVEGIPNFLQTQSNLCNVCLYPSVDAHRLPLFVRMPMLYITLLAFVCSYS